MAFELLLSKNKDRATLVQSGGEKMEVIKAFLIMSFATTCFAQEATTPLVDKQIKKSSAKMELQDAWANTTYAPTHDERLLLQNTSRKEVFLNGDLQTAPSFAEQNGDVAGAPTPERWKADPVTEMTEQVYNDQIAKKQKRFYRRALNNQYQQNIKDAGVSAPSRDIAQELDRLELIKEKKLDQ